MNCFNLSSNRVHTKSFETTVQLCTRKNFSPFCFISKDEDHLRNCPIYEKIKIAFCEENIKENLKYDIKTILGNDIQSILSQLEEYNSQLKSNFPIKLKSEKSAFDKVDPFIFVDHPDSPIQEELLSKLRKTFSVHLFVIAIQHNTTQQNILFNILMNSRINLSLGDNSSDILKKINMFVSTAEGGFLNFTEFPNLVHFIRKRRTVKWFFTEEKEIFYPFLTSEEDESKWQGDQLPIKELLELAQKSLLLTSKPGNISFKYSPNKSSTCNFFITPRQVDKSKVKFENLCFVKATISEYKIECWSPLNIKSSIDSGVQALLYNEYPQIESFLHFHFGHVLVKSKIKTNFPFPCGCVEEAKEIISVTNQHYKENQPFMVELKNHGFLLGIEKRGSFRLQKEWKKVKENLNINQKHLEITLEGKFKEFQFIPIFLETSICGSVILNQKLGKKVLQFLENISKDEKLYFKNLLK